MLLLGGHLVVATRLLRGYYAVTTVCNAVTIWILEVTTVLLGGLYPVTRRLIDGS